ncbi:MAG: M48 family metallopeptidase [Betaproteobacteria bacterium]|nr:M48 family metallopeptidase [Betaproteobacteria bacterium]
MTIRRPIAVSLLAGCLLGAPVLAQAPLPNLGGSGDALLSPQMERRLGESVVREIRSREPSYADDPEIAEYLADLGARLATGTVGGRTDFEFFVMRDPTINAFALPGGFVAVHTGLIGMAETESELASVLAHEMAHVNQHHISRMFGQEQRMQIPVMAAMAAALLLGRSRPDLATGAAAAVQAGTVSAQLSYSRDFEREADRVGFETLDAAGFDTRAMAAFFEKLQKATRVSDDNSVPGYLRTHPVTLERITVAQARAANLPYRQHRDSPEFQLVRAKIRALSGDATEMVASFRNAVADQRYASESAGRYGLAVALLRANQAREADAELARARKAGAVGPMIESLAARIKHAEGDAPAALSILSAARTRYPRSRALLYAHAEELLAAGRNQESLAILAEPVRLYPRDARLRRLQAQTYAALGKRLLQHQAQAEFYALEGSLPAAIEQLQLARAAGDGDFYELSVVDARLKELRAQDSLANATR